MRLESRPRTAATIFLVALTVIAAPGLSAQTPGSASTQRGAPSSSPAPLVVNAPGEVEISIEISPTTDTRELFVYADSGSFYRSTTIDLDGEDSEPVHSFTWHAFPAGEYDVVGMLVRSDGTAEVVVRGALRVVGR